MVTPVIYLPGMLGSPLYLPENGKRIWLAPNVMLASKGMDIDHPLEVHHNEVNQQDLPLLQREGGHLMKSFLLIQRLCFSFPEKPVYHFSYDFRQSSETNADSLHEEITYVLSVSSSSRVDIVCHSMGGFIVVSYLAKHGFSAIRKVIFLGVPYEGSPLITQILITGDIGVPNTLAEILGLSRSTFSAYPSIAELLSSCEYLQKYPIQKEGVMMTEEEMDAMFRSFLPETYDAGRSFQSRMHSEVYNQLVGDSRCFFAVGTGKKTPVSFSVDTSFSKIRDTETDEGDSEVPQYSSTMCGRLIPENPSRIQQFTCTHVELLRDKRVLDWICGILSE